ncbi:DUF2769 domain-containing protein [Methanosarcina sp. KYL-1]|uniref:DUF2769 domain-containing protein n=1 Tax=Methanosarcina sp. KYL-1 TaxID=2602068 RepID=UPI0021019405|nr:DUF2769 domain-containing protein [Methanosarcina sp. KYL-1]MCQ1536703.1 DUF2769 domain-containing protein [Methanosarcina sp. KYL-1]
MTETKEFPGETPDIIREARERYGRYFGICSSYHHLKACLCKSCPSYPGGAGMFCARDKIPGQGKKVGCLCETCELLKKFRLEGDYFCRKEEKAGFSEEGQWTSLNRCIESQECNGETRMCVLK